MSNHDEGLRRRYSEAYDAAFKGDQPRVPAGHGSPPWGGSSGEFASTGGTASGRERGPAQMRDPSNRPRLVGPERPQLPPPTVSIDRAKHSVGNLLAERWVGTQDEKAREGPPSDLDKQLADAIKGGGPGEVRQRLGEAADLIANLADNWRNLRAFQRDHPGVDPRTLSDADKEKFGLFNAHRPEFLKPFAVDDREGARDSPELRAMDKNIDGLARAWEAFPERGRQHVRDAVYGFLKGRYGLDDTPPAVMIVHSLTLQREQDMRRRAAAYDRAMKGAR